MTDPNRMTSNNNESGFQNSLYGPSMNLNPSVAEFMNNNSLNSNYQFLMRLSELSAKAQTGNQTMGYNNVSHGNYLQPAMSNLSLPVLGNSTNNELMNSFNWAAAVQFTQLLNNGGCGSLNNNDPNPWSQGPNNDQAWKTIQSLYSDLYNSVVSTQISNNNNFQSPININLYPQCDSQESFNDVLAKLGHGLNAAKRRKEEAIPDLIKDPIIQSSIGNKTFDSNNDRNSVISNNYDNIHSDFSNDLPIGLQSSYYTKSQNNDFSRNSSPAFNRCSSTNQGRGRGRPPKSTSSRSHPTASDIKCDSSNYSNIFEKPSPTIVTSPNINTFGDTQSNSTVSTTKCNIFVTTHVSSKLVIPPTISSVAKTKLNIEGSDNESKISNSTIKKSKEDSSNKVHSKKTSSTSSIEGTIEDVLKSFQEMHSLPINSMSSSLISSLSKNVSEISIPEDLTNTKQRHSKTTTVIDKRVKLNDQGSTIIYLKPLTNGWTRKTYLKSLTELIGDVEYESPSGQKFNSLSAIKDVLVNEKINNLSIEHFSFDISLRLGDYMKSSFNHIMGFEKLTTAEVELLFDRRIDIKNQMEMEDNKKSGNFQRKISEKISRNCLKTEKDLIKQKKEHKLIEIHISKELKKPVDDLKLLNSQSMPNFDEIQGNRLSKKSFSDCLLVSEFLYTFADVLGIDSETIPTMNDYQKAFVDRNSESLHIICWLLMELLKFAVCDPGITNTKLITQVMGVKFSDLEVNLNTLTGVLRAFILARAIGNESEMESWLIEMDYKELPGEQQAALLSFVVNEMLSSRLISCEVDKMLDQQSFIRRDKWILDGKLRRLKLIQSRKLCCSNGAIAVMNNNSSNSCNDSQMILETEYSTSVMDGDSDLDSINSNENMTSSQMNWSGEEDEAAFSSSLEDIEKHIEKLNNQVLQKKQDLHHCDHRLRGIFLGQDRFYRNFFLLRHLGGIYIDPAPESLKSNLDPDSIVDKINQIYGDKQSKTYEDDKLSLSSIEIPNSKHSLTILPQISNESFRNLSIKTEKSFFHEIPNLNPQLEPLDLRLSGSSDYQSCDIKQKSTCKTIENGINNKNIKNDWNLEIIDSATTMYANRAKYIYPEINHEQLKNYYRQQLEDYLRESNQHNAMEHLKSWISFYQVVLKNEQLNGEAIIPAIQLPVKNDRIKELAEKELERMGKQFYSKFQPIPNELKGSWHWIRSEDKLKSLVNSLHCRGFRERNLSKTIDRHYDLIISCFKQDISIVFNYDLQRCPTKLKVRSKRGKGRGNSHNHQPFTKITLSQSIANQMKLELCEQNDTFLAEITALEKVEDLISTVVTASLFKKGWKYPERVISDDTIKVIPSKLPKQFNFEMYPLDLGKERLLELEDQLERRYLLPPLNWEFKPKLSINIKDNNLKKTLDEVVSSSCGFEDTADSSSSFIDDNRSLSPSTNLIIPLDYDGKDETCFKTKVSDLIETPPGLVNWRKSVQDCKNDYQLLNCMRTLSNAIAWDKSIMKVLCQICLKDCNEAQLLLCDSCDQGYHTYCFRPPMTCIPEGQWFCHDCVSKATEQKLCYVCGQLKTARTMICISCKRMLHAACIKPPMTRVPRKWTCQNCTGKLLSEGLTKGSTLNNLPSFTKSSNNYAESNSCSNSNISNANSDVNLLCKPSSSSSISSNNILTRKRSCKRVLEPNAISFVPKKRTKHNNFDMKLNKTCSSEYLQPIKDSSSLKDEKILNSDFFNVESIKSIIFNISTVHSESFMSQADFDYCRCFLLEILDQDFVHPFLCPVDLRRVPIYKKIIRNPMDLTTIVRKLSEFVYPNAEQLSNDLKLIYTNCEQFNEDNSDVGKAGHALKSYFIRNWSPPIAYLKQSEGVIITDI